MTLTGMEYFVTLARERSFTRAAEKLHVTQQTLSASVATLERELGCPLLVRRVPLELTYAGTVFLRCATEVGQKIQSMRQELCDVAADQRGILRVGVAITRGRAIMPALIQRFQENYPHIEVELAESYNDTLSKNLRSGEIDLAIANLPASLPGIQQRDFYEEEVVLLVSYDLLTLLYQNEALDRVEQVERGQLSALSDCPFLMGNSADIAAQIGWAAIREAGFSPEIRARSDNIETLLALCVRGVGACFCPENLAQDTLSQGELDVLRVFRLGEKAKYPIRFGYLERPRQWNVISEFIKTALAGQK